MLMHRSQLLSVCMVCSLLATAGVAESAKKKVLLRPQYDPDLPKIGLFEAIDQQVISVQVVAKNAEEGAILVENLTDAPLTVELPEAIVGVQVLPQFGGGMGGGMGGMGGGMGGMGGGMGGMGGGMQAMGGGMGGGMGGMGGGGMGGGMGGGGGGFFSVPPDRIARVPYTSVCLEHGKPEPRPHAKYRLVRPEEFSDNPVLHEVLKLVATGKLPKPAAQAAAWHLASGMSWQELSAKTFNHVNAPDSPYFHPNDLLLAQNIVAEGQRRAKEAAERGDQPTPPVKSRVIPTASR